MKKITQFLKKIKPRLNINKNLLLNILRMLSISVLTAYLIAFLLPLYFEYFYKQTEPILGPGGDITTIVLTVSILISIYFIQDRFILDSESSVKAQITLSLSAGLLTFFFMYLNFVTFDFYSYYVDYMHKYATTEILQASTEDAVKESTEEIYADAQEAYDAGATHKTVLLDGSPYYDKYHRNPEIRKPNTRDLPEAKSLEEFVSEADQTIKRECEFYKGRESYRFCDDPEGATVAYYKRSIKNNGEIAARFIDKDHYLCNSFNNDIGGDGTIETIISVCKKTERNVDGLYISIVENSYIIQGEKMTKIPNFIKSWSRDDSSFNFTWIPDTSSYDWTCGYEHCPFASIVTSLNISDKIVHPVAESVLFRLNDLYMLEEFGTQEAKDIYKMEGEFVNLGKL